MTAYTKNGPWVDVPEGTTPPGGAIEILSAHLNHMEDGIANAQDAADAAIPSGEKGAAGGVATLDGTVKIPIAQIPSLATLYDPLGGANTAQTNAEAYADSLFGAGQLRPWQVAISAQGPHADGKLITDVNTTSGNNTFQSPTIANDPDAVGKWVHIIGGNDGQVPSLGEITAVNPATNDVTLDPTVLPNNLGIGHTWTGITAVYGTDDAIAFRDAETAAKTYAEAHNYFAEIVYDDKIYIVAAIIQNNDGEVLYNGCVPLARATDQNGRKLVISRRGVGKVDFNQYWGATVPALAGTTIVCMAFGPNTVDATYDFQSVFSGGIPQTGLPGAPDLPGAPKFLNQRAEFYNIQIVIPLFSNITGIDTRYCSGVDGDGCMVLALATPIEGVGPKLKDQWNWLGVFDAKHAVGWRTPLSGNNADTQIGSFSTSGVPVGIFGPAEHTTIGSLKIIYAASVFALSDSHEGHGLVIGRVTAEAYQVGISNNSTGAGGQANVNVGMWNTESSASVADVYDPNDALFGKMLFSNTVDNRAPLVTGGANFVIEQADNQALLAPFTEPAPTGSPHTGTVMWREVDYYVSSGAVTGVTINGVTIGVQTRWTVPPGKAWSYTYSAAPTVKGFPR